MRPIVLFFLAVVLSSSSLSVAFAENNIHQPQINIITTIKPITSLVAAIVGNDVEIQQLIPDFVSPHDYSFKPSDLRKIKSADVIFRIDEDMENLLTPAIKLRSKHSKLISLADDKNIELLGFSNESDETIKQHNQHDQHDHGNIDFHIWTSPKNSIVMATNIARTLIQIDPLGSKHYQANLDKFTQSVHSATTKIKKQLSPLKSTPFVVFHNSLQYFSHSFELKEPITISFHHSLTAGIKMIKETRQRISTGKVTCVFSDPSIRKKQVVVLTEKLNVNTASIDSMQSGVTPNIDTHVDWLLNTGTTITNCFNRK